MFQKEETMASIKHSFIIDLFNQAHSLLGYSVLNAVLELGKQSLCEMTAALMLQIQWIRWFTVILLITLIAPGPYLCCDLNDGQQGTSPEARGKRDLKQQEAGSGLASVLSPGSPISLIPFPFKRYQKKKKEKSSKILYTSQPHFLFSPVSMWILHTHTHAYTHTHTPLVISVGFCLGSGRSMFSNYEPEEKKAIDVAMCVLKSFISLNPLVCNSFTLKYLAYSRLSKYHLHTLITSLSFFQNATS